jgi:hypothetical protein
MFETVTTMKGNKRKCFLSLVLAAKGTLNGKAQQAREHLGRTSQRGADSQEALPSLLNQEFAQDAFAYTANDLLGNGTRACTSMFVSGSGRLSTLFQLHYGYNADNNLSQVHTSTDGNNTTLIHRPLKRIELGQEIHVLTTFINPGWLHRELFHALPMSDGQVVASAFDTVQQIMSIDWVELAKESLARNRESLSQLENLKR